MQYVCCSAQSVLRKFLSAFVVGFLCLSMNGCMALSVRFNQIGFGLESEQLNNICSHPSLIAPDLATKKISGRPGEAVHLDFTAGSYARVQFTNSANQSTYVTPSVSGNVTLPSRSGVYQVALIDPCTHLASYAMATVNEPFTSWSSTATNTLHLSHSTFRVWIDGSMASGDLNGDGHPDLMIGSGDNLLNTAVDAGAHIYLFDPVDSKFVASGKIADIAHVNGIKIADLNGDGKLDVVFGSRHYGGIQLAYGNGDGTFQAPLLLTPPAAAATGSLVIYDLDVIDYDRNGTADLIAVGGILNGGSWNSAVAGVFSGDGHGNFTSSLIELPVMGGFFTLAVADMNDDGKLDIVANGGYPLNRIYRIYQQDEGVFSILANGVDHDFVTSHTPTNPISVGYLNSDRKPEIIENVTNGGGFIRVYNSNASDSTLTLASSPGFYSQSAGRVKILDIDADGTNDLFMGFRNRAIHSDFTVINQPGVLVMNESNYSNFNTYGAGEIILGASNANHTYMSTSPLVEDFNGDGKLDVFMLHGRQINGYTGDADIAFAQ